MRSGRGRAPRRSRPAAAVDRANPPCDVPQDTRACRPHRRSRWPKSSCTWACRRPARLPSRQRCSLRRSSSRRSACCSRAARTTSSASRRSTSWASVRRADVPMPRPAPFRRMVAEIDAYGGERVVVSEEELGLARPVQVRRVVRALSGTRCSWWSGRATSAARSSRPGSRASCGRRPKPRTRGEGPRSMEVLASSARAASFQLGRGRARPQACSDRGAERVSSWRPSASAVRPA
jgi:hypothetical protein